MISDQFIKDTSTKWQTSELNVRREYIQHLFLSHFYSYSDSGKIYFKGGTALRIIYSSPRFSEDLDFSSTSSTFTKIEDIIIQTIKEIEREGIKIDIKESKVTTGGYLAIINFSLQGQKIDIKLEISQRKEKNIGEIITIANDYILPYTMMAITKDLLVAGKVYALLDRQKARDFFDLYYILRANLLPAKEKDILKKVLILLEKSDIQFPKELKIFLPKSHWGIIKDFKKILVQEIRRVI
jgi:predicted nucleotidyltransferase component of viral defense system